MNECTRLQLFGWVLLQIRKAGALTDARYSFGTDRCKAEGGNTLSLQGLRNAQAQTHTSLVVEEAQVGEGHGNAVLVAGGLDIAVAVAAAGLRDEAHAELGRVVD